MNAEMMQRLIEFGIRQERSRAEFIAELTMKTVPVIGTENQPEPLSATRPIKAPRRGRKPSANGLATQIRTLLGENGNSGTAADIAIALAEPDKKVTAALNSMKARGIVLKAGKCWSLAGSNGAASAA